MSVLTAECEVVNAKGLHVRAATVLAQLAGTFTSTVVLEHAGERANAKSVMHLLLLTAPLGAVVKVIIDGDDATDALAAVVELIANGFGES
jgi:phosphocarrier protein HPr